MNRLLLLVPAWATLTGCIIYTEDDPAGAVDDGYDWNDGYDDDDRDAPNDGEPDVDVPPPTNEPPRPPPATVDPAAFALDPPAGLPGSSILAVLTAADADLDLTTITEVAFFGEAKLEIDASRALSETEFTLSFRIADDAMPGAQDLLVRFEDGTGVFVEDVFTVEDAPVDTADTAAP